MPPNIIMETIMKKFLPLLVLSTIFVTICSADMTRLEVGAGAWKQKPTGYISRADGNGVLDLSGTYNSLETETTEAYAWLLFKHPVPIIPNIRLEYVTITDSGKTTGKVGGMQIPGSAPTTLDTQEYDIIPYYNLLDNTFWTTIDLGIDAKVITTKAKVSPLFGFMGYTSQETVVTPLVYVRARVEIPMTGLGIESDVKYITFNGSTMYDIRAKIDYTFDFAVIEPGVEFGYRTQKLLVDDGLTQVDLDYSGFYAGVMLRF